MKYLKIELSGKEIKVLKSDIKAAVEAWKHQEHLLIERSGYVIEIPIDTEMENPTSLILDGVDYIYQV